MSEEKAIQKDAVFDASIEFIKTLTGMEPPPIEIAPPEVLKPFREFTEKVCSIFHNSPPQRTWVGLMRGVRVEGDTVVISVKGGNDAARELCGALIEEMNR